MHCWRFTRPVAVAEIHQAITGIRKPPRVVFLGMLT
jgi:hypothetical protein